MCNTDVLGPLYFVLSVPVSVCKWIDEIQTKPKTQSLE